MSETSELPEVMAEPDIANAAEEDDLEQMENEALEVIQKSQSNVIANEEPIAPEPEPVDFGSADPEPEAMVNDEEPTATEIQDSEGLVETPVPTLEEAVEPEEPREETIDDVIEHLKDLSSVLSNTSSIFDKIKPMIEPLSKEHVRKLRRTLEKLLKRSKASQSGIQNLLNHLESIHPAKTGRLKCEIPQIVICNGPVMHGQVPKVMVCCQPQSVQRPHLQAANMHNCCPKCTGSGQQFLNQHNCFSQQSCIQLRPCIQGLARCPKCQLVKPAPTYNCCKKCRCKSIDGSGDGEKDEGEEDEEEYYNPFEDVVAEDQNEKQKEGDDGVGGHGDGAGDVMLSDEPVNDDESVNDDEPTTEDKKKKKKKKSKKTNKKVKSEKKKPVKKSSPKKRVSKDRQKGEEISKQPENPRQSSKAGAKRFSRLPAFVKDWPQQQSPLCTAAQSKIMLLKIRKDCCALNAMSREFCCKSVLTMPSNLVCCN